MALTWRDPLLQEEQRSTHLAALCQTKLEVRLGSLRPISISVRLAQPLSCGYHHWQRDFQFQFAFREDSSPLRGPCILRHTAAFAFDRPRGRQCRQEEISSSYHVPPS